MPVRKKSAGLNIHNFRIICVLWNGDPDRIIFIVTHAVRLQYNSKQWEYAKSVLLKKLNKRNCTLVNSYRVISLLNSLGKIVEKLVA